MDAELLAACPDLKAVCSMAVGYNNIDVAACTARGVLASNAPGVLTETTADLGFALMMAAARRVGESERFLRRGEWTRWAVDMFAGSDVHGATLGILGMGRIGQAIARRGALGFSMPVVYHNRSRLDPAVEAELGARYVSKDALLRESDHIVIVVPYSAGVASPDRRGRAVDDEADRDLDQHRARRPRRRRRARRGAARQAHRRRRPRRVRGRADGPSRACSRCRTSC